jgi:hypothetical protein
MIQMKTEETNDKPATSAERGVHVAPANASSKKGARQKKGAPKARKSAKPARPAKAQRAGAKKGAPDARSNKKAEVIALMKRAKGDAGRDRGSHGLAEAHVRGFVRTLGSNGGEKIESSTNAAGERSYRIAK